jgi:hypothetical protein
VAYRDIARRPSGPGRGNTPTRSARWPRRSGKDPEGMTMPTRREREERAEYDRLHAKYGRASKRQRSEPANRRAEDDDDSPLLVLSGKRADSFLSRLFDQADDEDQADDDEADDDEEDQADDDDDDDDDEDPGPPPGHKFFRGRGGRG